MSRAAVMSTSSMLEAGKIAGWMSGEGFPARQIDIEPRGGKWAVTVPRRMMKAAVGAFRRALKNPRRRKGKCPPGQILEPISEKCVDPLFNGRGGRRNPLTLGERQRIARQAMILAKDAVRAAETGKRQVARTLADEIWGMVHAVAQTKVSKHRDLLKRRVKDLFYAADAAARNKVTPAHKREYNPCGGRKMARSRRNVSHYVVYDPRTKKFMTEKGFGSVKSASKIREDDPLFGKIKRAAAAKGLKLVPWPIAAVQDLMGFYTPYKGSRKNRGRRVRNNGMKVFIALGPMCWGKGVTEEDAYRNMKERCSSGAQKWKRKIIHIMYEGPCEVDPWVDQMGSVRWTIVKKDGKELGMKEKYRHLPPDAK